MAGAIGTDRAVLSTDLPLLAVVPLVDLTALLAAVSLGRGPSGVTLSFTAAAMILLASARTRPTRMTLSLGEDAAAIVRRLAAAALGVSLFASRSGTTRDFVTTAAIGIAFVLAGRAVSYSIVRALRRRGIALERTLIVGAGGVGVAIANALRLHPEHGLAPVGFVDTVDAERDLPLPLIGPIDEIASLVGLHGVRRIIVAFSATDDHHVAPVLRACDRLSVEIHVVPRFYELGVATENAPEDIAGIPIMRLHRGVHRSGSWPAKRAIDVALSGVALVALSPLLGLLALLVRVSSPGAILFRQRRIGENGKPIEILKFRTMRENTDSDTTWSVDHDSRLTVVGRILRQTHLDELPQLINVLRGDMSVVGPRPERPYFAELFAAEVPGYRERHRVPVGMTGWAQVNGLNGDTSIEERVRFDNRYIERWSVWRDLVIMARTGTAVLSGLRSKNQKPKPVEETVAAVPVVVDLREVEIDLTSLENGDHADSTDGDHAAKEAPVNVKGMTRGNGNGNGTGNGHHSAASDGTARP